MLHATPYGRSRTSDSYPSRSKGSDHAEGRPRASWFQQVRSGQIWRHKPEQRVAAYTSRQYSLFVPCLAIAQADTRPPCPYPLDRTQDTDRISGRRASPVFRGGPGFSRVHLGLPSLTPCGDTDRRQAAHCGRHADAWCGHEVLRCNLGLRRLLMALVTFSAPDCDNKKNKNNKICCHF